MAHECFRPTVETLGQVFQVADDPISCVTWRGANGIDGQARSRHHRIRPSHRWTKFPEQLQGSQLAELGATVAIDPTLLFVIINAERHKHDLASNARYLV